MQQGQVSHHKSGIWNKVDASRTLCLKRGRHGNQRGRSTAFRKHEEIGSTKSDGGRRAGKLGIHASRFESDYCGEAKNIARMEGIVRC